MQKGLLREDHVSYTIDWCKTPDRRKPGVAFLDKAMLGDVGDDNVTLVPHSPSNDIHLSIGHALLDPVLASAVDELDEFLAQTFWANDAVFNCFMAAQALAKRGENIDRLFIGISPGGTGQSL